MDANHSEYQQLHDRLKRMIRETTDLFGLQNMKIYEAAARQGKLSQDNLRQVVEAFECFLSARAANLQAQEAARTQHPSPIEAEAARHKAARHYRIYRNAADNLMDTLRQIPPFRG